MVGWRGIRGDFLPLGREDFEGPGLWQIGFGVKRGGAEIAEVFLCWKSGGPAWRG